jgi:integrase
MLTDADCRAATCPPELRQRRLTDSGGLFLEVTPNGSKRWFWRYTIAGKVKALPLGSYCKPGSAQVLVGLKAARAARNDARAIKDTGVDPLQQRKADKLAANISSATTFVAVAAEFYAQERDGWSDTYAQKWHRLVERDLSPWLGTLPLAGISAPMLLDALKRTERRGAIDTAHALRQYAGQVFRYGIATGRCTGNPAADLAGALKPLQVKHMGAVLDPVQAGALMRDIDGYTGQPVTRTALALSALLFQRPGNIRAMEWTEIDTDAALWTIPAAKMKRTVHGKVNGRPHLVPLAPQALALLADLKPLTGHGRFVFPSLLTGEACMSENTIRAALRRMGYDNDTMTPHGFRAMARTLIAERLPGIALDVIEAQLAHGKSGPLGMAYDRAEYMDQRRAMMSAWADYLDRLRAGARVLPFKAASD